RPGHGDNDVISRAPLTAQVSAAPSGANPEVMGVPWHSPQSLNRLARERMSREDRLTLAKLLAQD
ncbi:hypothetical protein ACFWSO_37835, partial [Streptomyces sp. NPDC058572]